jgi:hypothetical protein
MCDRVLTATRLSAPDGLYANPYMIVSFEDYVVTVYSVYCTVKLTRRANHCLVRRFFGAVTYCMTTPPLKASSGDAR